MFRAADEEIFLLYLIRTLAASHYAGLEEEASVRLSLRMRGLYVFVLAVISQIQWQYIKPKICGKEGDELAFRSYLKIYNSALQLRWLEVAQCLQCEGVVKHQQIFFIGYQEVSTFAVLEADRVVVGLS